MLQAIMLPAKSGPLLSSCGCCPAGFAASSPAPTRRNFLAGGIASLGLGAAIPAARPAHGAARQDPDRRASPFHSARARRRDGDTAQRRAAAEMVGADVARRHGQERHRHLDRLAGAAGHLVRRRCPAVAQARPRMQRIRGEDDRGSSRPLRPVRHHLAAGHRRQPQGDRIRARHAQGRRHRADDELRRQVSRRSVRSSRSIRNSTGATRWSMCTRPRRTAAAG